MPLPTILPRADAPSIAYHRSEGKSPTVVFLGGFRSDMTGQKALALEAFSRRRGLSFLRFDYTGHGQSQGDFLDGTIESWRRDSLDAIDRLTEGKLILVGSSMGGWMMLLAALARRERVELSRLSRAGPETGMGGGEEWQFNRPGGRSRVAPDQERGQADRDRCRPRHDLRPAATQLSATR